METRAVALFSLFYLDDMTTCGSARILNAEHLVIVRALQEIRLEHNQDRPVAWARRGHQPMASCYSNIGQILIIMLASMPPLYVDIFWQISQWKNTTTILCEPFPLGMHTLSVLAPITCKPQLNDNCGPCFELGLRNYRDIPTLQMAHIIIRSCVADQIQSFDKSHPPKTPLSVVL